MTGTGRNISKAQFLREERDRQAIANGSLIIPDTVSCTYHGSQPVAAVGTFRCEACQNLGAYDDMTVARALHDEHLAKRRRRRTLEGSDP